MSKQKLSKELQAKAQELTDSYNSQMLSLTADLEKKKASIVEGYPHSFFIEADLNLEYSQKMEEVGRPFREFLFKHIPIETKALQDERYERARETYTDALNSRETKTDD